MIAGHEMRMLPKSKRKSSVATSLSELSVLWGKTDMENPEPADTTGPENNPMPDSSTGLDDARTRGNGNPQTGEGGKNAD